jgi:tetratricopeptide (TPR) repeat protein
MRVVASLALALVLGACGGGSKPVGPGKPGDRGAALEPVKPEALREFDKAMRMLRRDARDDDGEAQARLERALELDASLWEAWHDLGVIHLAAGDVDEATTAFGKALGINPGHAPTLLGRAEAARAADQGSAARDDYRAALALLADDDPLRSGAAARLASLLRDQRAYDDAIEVLRDTLRRAGESAGVYTELGMIYLAQTRLDLAALVLSKAAELDGKDPAVANAQALLALARGDSQTAFARFDAAASLDPDYIDARFNKASVLMDAGDYARARQELDALLDRRPGDLEASVALGICARALGKFDDARALWDAVIERAPRRSAARADAIFNRAILKADFLEDVAGAKQDLEQYLQDAPKRHHMRAAADEKRKELGL